VSFYLKEGDFIAARLFDAITLLLFIIRKCAPGIRVGDPEVEPPGIPRGQCGLKWPCLLDHKAFLHNELKINVISRDIVGRLKFDKAFGKETYTLSFYKKKFYKKMRERESSL